MAKEVPLSELLMQDPDPIVDLTSPLNSVDDSSKSRMFVQEELEKRLKQRVGRQDLVERNILPPLSFPTAPKLFTHTQQLHRAQIADNLQKRMRNRPARDNLMQMNILPDLQINIDPALQATQLQLRKSKLADTLNDKLANRPGPLQLLQNGIIEPHLSEVVQGYELDQPAGSEDSPEKSETDKSMYASIPEISLFSGEGFSGSPQPRPLLQQRHSIDGVSMSTDSAHRMDTSMSPSIVGETRKSSDSSLSPAPSPAGILEEARSPEKSPRGFNSTYPPILRNSMSTGVLMATSGSSKVSSPNISRKKQTKKYRKLRYHEYIPPSKSTPKGGKTNPKPPSKSSESGSGPYSSLLQQQQLFLQLQVLQQQYPNGVLMQKLPDMINTMSKDQKALAIAAVKGRISVTSPTDLGLTKQSSIPQTLPVEMPNKHNTMSVRFEDLKVNDLKNACKELGMIVSGKKAELVERLMDHNKGMLPAIALPDNLTKDGRKQAFSQGHASSVDSQFSTSSTLSPNSPNPSPVFKFPSDRSSGEGVAGATAKQTNRVQIAEVFPASNLHKEFNEMIERQKRNYICQKGMSEKSIAPRPELAEMLAIKLPTGYPTTTASASHMEQRVKGGRAIDSRSQIDKSSRSLPPSPKPDSPRPDLMDSCNNSELDSRVPPLTVFSSANSETRLHSLGSIPASGHGDMMNHHSSSGTQVGGVGMYAVSAASGSTLTTSYYQQQQQASSLSGKQAPMRPGRTSVPTPTQSSGGGAHPVGLPSYTSIMRSRSIAGTHSNVMGMQNNGVTFAPGMATPPSDKQLNPDLFVSDSSVEMEMDTGGSSISDIFDILRAEGEEFSSHPVSLPGLSENHHQSQRAHSSLPQTPQYGSGGSSAPKLGQTVHQDPAAQSSTNYMLGNIMPFGNPSLTAQNKSGSDVCLNLPDGTRDGQKNSVGGPGLYVATNNNNLVLGNELNWLDLDNTSSLGLSPTLHGSTFGNLNSHSNPGSLPHDQFHSSFLEDEIGGQVGLMGNLAKNSNPAMNGYGLGGSVAGVGMQYIDNAGVMQQSGLYPSTEEERLLELGLSTS